VPASGNLLVAAAIIGFFVLACVGSATRKDVTTGFDEPAHASYAWPDLKRLRLLDPHTFDFTGEPDYLNHPPLFYALLAAIGPKLEGRPQALLAYRLFDVALVAAGFAALLALSLLAPFSRAEFYAYALPLVWIPILVQLAATVTNDDLAFFGGALATLGVWQLVATGRGLWLACALIGMVAAAWAKLTGLLLIAAMVGAALMYLQWRGRKRLSWMMVAGAVLVLAAAPYIIFVWQYGSPTPEIPAQIALLQDGARAAGWTDLPRKSFPLYLASFIVAFIADWMPVLAARSASNHAMLAIPAAALVCALAGAAPSLRRL